MKCVYNITDLYNLAMVKEARQWAKHRLISAEQAEVIRGAYVSKLYHPNLVIRILLFIATVLALWGVSGIFFLMFGDLGETGISFMALIAGVGSFVLVQKVLVEGNHHYKSGVVEAIIYHGCAYVIGGVAGLTDANVHVLLLISFVVLTYVAIRYLDLICTTLAVLVLAGFLFYECYELGGIFRQIIPFVLIAAFSGVYFLARWWKANAEMEVWQDTIVVVESLSLLLIYTGGNYLVVRELSIALMDLALEEGQDIPFAFLFYGLTVIIPTSYLYFGIRNKDVVMLRVSLLVLAFSVFTFKYYFSLGHPEITLTVAGAFLLLVTGWLFQFLKTPRGAFTRENLLSHKWGDENVSAFVISQTLGGNEVKRDDGFKGGGGEFGGGGASGSF
jgi:hypothetical protein